jgi:hypothetical protein
MPRNMISFDRSVFFLFDNKIKRTKIKLVELIEKVNVEKQIESEKRLAHEPRALIRFVGEAAALFLRSTPTKGSFIYGEDPQASEKRSKTTDISKIPPKTTATHASCFLPLRRAQK